MGWRRTALANYNVEVRGEPNTVAVTHKSKALWLATGTFRGNVIVGQGRTEPASLRAWKRVAEELCAPSDGRKSS
jgi:hypothetical protein